MKRLPDLLFGALLAVAIFALGAAVGFNYQPENGASQIKHENFGEWLSRDATGFFTPWLVVIGIAQLGLFFRQLWLIRESLKDAIITATAAKVSADAAKESAKATRANADTAQINMITSERAYVHFNGIGWISHRNIKDGFVFWRLHPRWINGGNTPTRHLHVYVHYEFRDDELPADYAFRPMQHPEVPALIAPHQTLEGSDLIAVREGKKRLYVWGNVIAIMIENVDADGRREIAAISLRIKHANEC